MPLISTLHAVCQINLPPVLPATTEVTGKLWRNHDICRRSGGSQEAAFMPEDAKVSEYDGQVDKRC